MNKITNIRQNNYINTVDGVTTIKDANGDTVSNNIYDFINVNTTTNSSPSVSNVTDDIKKNNSFFRVICDSNNNIMSQDDMIEAIKNKTATSLDVTIEITHTGIPINHAYYDSESMCEDFLTLTNPYNKPLIKNHLLYEEPIGRVSDATFGPSNIIDGYDTITATFTVSDEDSMLKFADGRYDTVSIGADSGHIKCDLCRKTILKDGVLDFCGHWRGNRYKGKIATWTMTKLDYREVSVVNNPADKFAQVVKVKLNTGGNNTVKNTQEGTTNNTQENEVLNTQDNNVLNTIDNVLNGQTVQSENTDQNVNNSFENNTNNTGPSQDKEDNDNTQEVVNSKEYKELEEKYNSVLNENKTLQDTIDSLNIDIQNYKSDLDLKNSNIETLNNNLKSLATLNLSLLKDKLTLINPDVDTTILDSKSAVELNQMIEHAKIEQSKRTSKVIVENPGLSIDQKDILNKKTEDSKAITFNDVSDKILNNWR